MDPEYEDVYEYFANARVNVEMLFIAPRIGNIIVNCRVRPWKNAAQDGLMILQDGATVDEALTNAMRAIFAHQWVPLDWRARIGAGVPTSTPTDRPPVELPTGDLAKRLERFSTPNPIPISNGIKNGPKGVS
jgi:hypothetical protein